MSKNQIWDFIINNKIATKNELQLITCINGYNKKALNNVIFARIGYHDAEQAIDCEPGNYNL
jgi:UTP-glucose-1-phosphate uridylyltransferase|tara:strand:- start:334 stop:519 length:186 start_codon:yes stop_codon:yes gene_type:complete